MYRPSMSPCERNLSGQSDAMYKMARLFYSDELGWLSRLRPLDSCKITDGGVAGGVPPHEGRRLRPTARRVKREKLAFSRFSQDRESTSAGQILFALQSAPPL